MLRNVDTDVVNRGNITVYLRSGVVYENCDFPTQVFSEYEQIVTFWHENKLMNIPMDLVKSVIFNPPE